MKKKLVYFLIFIVAAIFQLSFMPIVSGGHPSADAVLMAVLAWSVLDGFAAFLGWAIFFGLFYDLISYATVGVHALIFLAVVYFVSFFSRRFSMEFKGVGLLLFLAFVVVATLVSHAIIASTLAFQMGTLQGWWKSFGTAGSILIQLASNAILFLLCFAVIKKAKQFFAIAV